LVRGFGVTSVENRLPVDADTIFVAGSLTKPVVATAAICLVGDGRLDLDVPLVRYLPDLRLADAGRDGCGHDAPPPDAYLGLRSAMTSKGRVFGPGDDALARAIATFGNRPQVLPLGSLWSYNNSAYWLAGRVVEVVTGMSLEAALTDLVLQPLGMASSFFFEKDVITRRLAVGHNASGTGRAEIAQPWSPPRAQRGAGGLLTTIRDLMKFASLQLHDQFRHVPGALKKAATTMQQPQVPGEGSNAAGLQLDPPGCRRPSSDLARR
jgi:CubicO group peptidase (beta-lactamase class C family)